MKVFGMFLAGLAVIPAIFFLFSSAIGLLNAVGGTPVYGSQRAVASLLLCALFLIIAFVLWPRENKGSSKSIDEFNTLPDSQSRADFIASKAASRLGVSSNEFNRLLTTDLNYSPVEVMNLWDELAEDFGVDLSSDDFPEINSIEDLRARLNS